MEIGIIFDWVLGIFLAGSGLAKVLGMEKAGAEKMGVHYNWIIVIGVTQLFAIYFIYAKLFLVVLVVVGGPYMYFGVRSIFRKEPMIVAILFAITAMIAARWLFYTGMI